MAVLKVVGVFLDCVGRLLCRCLECQCTMDTCIVHVLRCTVAACDALYGRMVMGSLHWCVLRCAHASNTLVVLLVLAIAYKCVEAKDTLFEVMVLCDIIDLTCRSHSLHSDILQKWVNNSIILHNQYSTGSSVHVCVGVNALQGHNLFLLTVMGKNRVCL